jgi:uncharacterized protein (TIGR00255 family)
MTLQSMTGFGRGEAQGQAYTVTVEIKSVNNRYKDFRFKMSSLFNEAESQFKSQMITFFSRGSFEVFVHYKKNDGDKKSSVIDLEKVKSFISLFQDFETTVKPTDFLRQEFYKDESDEKNGELIDLAHLALKNACEDLKVSRAAEGDKLKLAIEKYLGHFDKHYGALKPLSESIEDMVKSKLLKRFREIEGLDIDEPRLMQEIVYYLEKLDVSEELDRIDSHLAKMTSLLNSNQEVGRQIDFLVQELNRETNTIGSKSSLEEVSSHVVQMKVQLEKIREQGLNLQ